MSSIQFIAHGKPEPQGSTRAFIPKGWKRPIITSDNPNLKAWRAVVSAAARIVWIGVPLTCAVAVELHFVLPRPKSLPKRFTHAVKKPDLDKLIRAVLDALTGVILADDSQCVNIVAWKRYESESERPGVLVNVDTVDELASK